MSSSHSRRISIVTVGSRGDVQPYIALARGLIARGHDVRLATHAPFEPLIQSYGVPFTPIAGDPQAILEQEAGRVWLETGHNPLRYWRQVSTLMEPLVDPMLADYSKICRDVDAVIFSPLAYPCYNMALDAGIPCLMASPIPISPTREFPFVLFPPGRSLGGPLNWLSHQVLWLAIAALRPRLNTWRRLQNLPRIRRPDQVLLDALLNPKPIACLYGYSAHVLPRPADWGPELHVTGYWFLDRPTAWEPPAELTAFLAAGPPPVYVGFGSMTTRDPQAQVALVLAAIAQSGQRAILSKGWSGLAAKELPEGVFAIGEVPHEWLFPRMAAIVTHGGAGTTAAALRAGVPTLVVPHFADQPFWASRVQALGAGPPPLPKATLTAAALAAGIHVAATDTAMRERAARVGERIRAEDGVATAIAAFEKFMDVAPRAVTELRIRRNSHDG